MPWLYQNVPLQSSGDIRILLLHQAATDDEPILCELNVVSLNQTPMYEALSYTWGAPFEGQILAHERILLCGEDFEITGNLYAALRRFPLRDGPRVMWIDAVCIDQSSNEERSAQVAIMSKIYAAANRVLIWLGEDSRVSDGHVTLRVLDHLAVKVTDWDIVQSIMSSRHSDGGPKAHSHELIMSRLLPQELYNEPASANTPTAPSDHTYVWSVFKKIHIFFTRRYFRRLWVVQEMYHARNAIIYCGPDQIYWQRFQRGFDRLRKASSSLLLKGTHRNGSLDVLQGTMIERLANLFQFSKREGFFLKCIEQCNGTHCQDPRDRVFALSSLNSAEWPQPDYSLSVSQVFLSFSKSCVDHKYTQSLLFHAARQLSDPIKGSLRRKLQPALPTWAIDWQQQNEIGTRFWDDWASEGGPDLQASVDSQSGLWCNLGVLGTVIPCNESSHGELALQTSDGASSETECSSVVSNVWSLFSARCGVDIKVGDVLCRIPGSEEFMLDEADGLVVSRRAAKRPISKFYEDAVIALRPVAPEMEGYTIAALNERVPFTNRQLRSLPNDQQWQRFCIV